MPIRATPSSSAQNRLAGNVFWRMQPTGENSIGQNTGGGSRKRVVSASLNSLIGRIPVIQSGFGLRAVEGKGRKWSG